MQINKIISYLENAEINEFVALHQNMDINALILKFNQKIAYDIKIIAEIIDIKKRAKHKIPLLIEHNLAANKISFEQCTHQVVSEYRCKQMKGKYGLNITGGLGIDDIFLSNQFEILDSYEINLDIHEFATYNQKKLNIHNLNRIYGNGLHAFDKNVMYDWVFIDPDRRVLNSKAIIFEHMSPNVLECLELIFKHTQNICIKLSPLIDLTYLKNKLPFLKTIEVISYQNEVKEVCCFLKKDFSESITIKATELTNVSNFSLENLSKTKSEVTEGPIIYEPSVAFVKANLCIELAQYYGLQLIEQNGLYLNGPLINFEAGRKFEIISEYLYKAKTFSQYLKLLKIIKANFAKRNFPFTVLELRKTHKIAEGGHDYFFFTSNIFQQLIVIHAIKIK